VKSATTVLALLVAMVLFVPAPVSAAGLPNLDRSGTRAALEQEEPGATPTSSIESTEAAPTEPAATPEPTAEPTTEPTAEPTAGAEPQADEDSSGVTDLHATAARLRGRVELGWRAGDGAEEGNFVVERSTNGSSWRPVKACSTRFDPDQSGYGCTDTRLTSGTTYTYRVCLTAKGSTCANATPSEPVTVKAP
jgi:hypothetical protein